MDIQEAAPGRLVDFSLLDNEGRFLYLERISEILADTIDADPMDLAPIIIDYLVVDEHTVFGYRGDFVGSLTALLIITPITPEAFVHIMAGKYEFSRKEGDLFLPQPKDVRRHNDSEFVLVAASGYDSARGEDFREMTRYARDFLSKRAKCSIGMIGLTKGLEMDPDLRQIVGEPTGITNLRNAGYSAHVSAIGQIYRPGALRWN